MFNAVFLDVFADSFGIRAAQSTLREVVEMQDKNAKKNVSVKTGSKSSASDAQPTAPLYTFCTPSQQWSAQLLADAPVPVCLVRSASDESLNSKIGDYSEAEVEGDSSRPSSWQYEIQFYLGQRDTGAPVHFHGHAVNTLVYGEKVCYLCFAAGLIAFLVCLLLFAAMVPLSAH